LAQGSRDLFSSMSKVAVAPMELAPLARGQIVKVTGPDDCGATEHVGKVGQVREGPDQDGACRVCFPEAGAWSELGGDGDVRRFPAGSLARAAKAPGKPSAPSSSAGRPEAALPTLLGRPEEPGLQDAELDAAATAAAGAACLSLAAATPLLVLSALQLQAGLRLGGRDCDQKFARHLQQAGAGGLTLGLVPFVLSLVALFKLRCGGCCSWCVAGCCGVLLPTAGIMLSIFASVMWVLGFVLWGEFEEGQCDGELRDQFYFLAIVPTYVALALGPALSCLRCLQRMCCCGEGK